MIYDETCKVLFVDTLVINQYINIHSLATLRPTLNRHNWIRVYKTYGVIYNNVFGKCKPELRIILSKKYVNINSNI